MSSGVFQRSEADSDEPSGRHWNAIVGSAAALALVGLYGIAFGQPCFLCRRLSRSANDEPESKGTRETRGLLLPVLPQSQSRRPRTALVVIRPEPTRYEESNAMPSSKGGASLIWSFVRFTNTFSSS